MNTLEQLYAQLRENSRYQADLEKAKQTFAFQPFAVEFRPVFQSAIASRFVLGLFSICTGYFALYDPFVAALPFWLAAAFAAILLIGVESAKSLSIYLTFKYYYKQGKMPILGLLSLGCLAVSVWLSLTGVQTLYRSLDSSSEGLESFYLASRDSLEKAYKMQILQEKQALADYKKSVTHQGRIDISNKANRKVIAGYADVIQRLEQERATALAELKADRAQARTQLEAKTGFNIAFWVSLSGVIEALIFLCGWFMMYFRYRQVQDGDLLSSPETFTVSMPDLQRLANMVLLNHTQYAGAPVLSAGKQAAIGFKSSQQNQENPVGNQEKPHSVSTQSDSVKNHAALIADIQSGITDYRTLVKKHSVNVLTVKKYMEQYGKK